MSRRIFTVAEVDALIPHLEEVLARVRIGLGGVREAGDRLQVLDLLWGDAVRDPSNPDHREWREHQARGEAEAGAVREILEREIVARGIRFPQGGLEHGLLDFPTTFEGRWVYLCWRSGEPRLSAWHELDGGFAGRRPLRPEHAQAMGRPSAGGPPDDSALDF